MPRDNPCWRTLEYSERGTFARYLWDYLSCCGASAYDPESLAADVVTPVPARRVHNFTPERAEVLELGELRIVELAGACDEEIGRDGVGFAFFGFFATVTADRGCPLQGVGVPPRFYERLIEADVPVELVFVGYRDEVVLNLFLTWVLARPVWVLLEGEGVQMAEYLGRGQPIVPLGSDTGEALPSQQHPGYVLSCHVPPT